MIYCFLFIFINILLLDSKRSGWVVERWSPQSGNWEIMSLSLKSSTKKKKKILLSQVFNIYIISYMHTFVITQVLSMLLLLAPASRLLIENNVDAGLVLKCLCVHRRNLRGQFLATCARQDHCICFHRSMG